MVNLHAINSFFLETAGWVVCWQEEFWQFLTLFIVFEIESLIQYDWIAANDENDHAKPTKCD